MLHSQGFYPQGLNPFYPQGLVPQGLNPFYPQGLTPQGLNLQGGFNNPQAGVHNPGGVYPQGSPQGGVGYFDNTPGYFANTLYGLPQHAFVQGSSPQANWQHPAQQAVQQLLTQQLAAQVGTPSAGGALGGLSNGAGAQATAAWPQHNNSGQINPTVQQQWMQQPSFQQLAQHHYAIAQQLLQLAAQQTLQGTASPYAGQFIPGQIAPFVPATMGGSFVPGITMH
jgi:hypothetical protein